MKNEYSMKQLKRRLQERRLDEEFSDESAYLLYQIAGTISDWVLEQFDAKIKRFLLYTHGIDVKENYDPHRRYDDSNDVNEDPPF